MKVQTLTRRDGLKPLAEWLPGAARRFGVGGYARGLDAAPSVESLAERIDAKTAFYSAMIVGAEPGLIIVENSPWEQGVIKKPFARVQFLGADSYEGALALLKAATKKMKREGVVLARAAAGIAPGYIQVAYGEAGFYLASQLMTLAADIEQLWKKLERVPEGRTSFRIATARDADAVARVAEGAFGEGRFVSDPNFPRKWGNKLYVNWARVMTTSDEHALLLMEQDGKVVGCANLQRDTTKVPRVPGLFVVTKDAQGSGLGAVLLRRVIQEYRSAGKQYPLITTEKSNTAVNTLFFRLGYWIEDVNVIYHWTPRK